MKSKEQTMNGEPTLFSLKSVTINAFRKVATVGMDTPAIWFNTYPIPEKPMKETGGVIYLDIGAWNFFPTLSTSPPPTLQSQPPHRYHSKHLLRF